LIICYFNNRNAQELKEQAEQAQQAEEKTRADAAAEQLRQAAAEQQRQQEEAERKKTEAERQRQTVVSEWSHAYAEASAAYANGDYTNAVVHATEALLIIPNEQKATKLENDARYQLEAQARLQQITTAGQVQSPLVSRLQNPVNQNNNSQETELLKLLLGVWQPSETNYSGTLGTFKGNLTISGNSIHSLAISGDFSYEISLGRRREGLDALFLSPTTLFFSCDASVKSAESYVAGDAGPSLPSDWNKWFDLYPQNRAGTLGNSFYYVLDGTFSTKNPSPKHASTRAIATLDGQSLKVAVLIENDYRSIGRGYEIGTFDIFFNRTH
jgi:hypothetical protein